MGPSGAGKTTLLAALANQLPKNKKLKITGQLAYSHGGAGARSRRPPRLGFVQQDDAFFSQLTVRETLDLAAALRLPRASGPEREAAVARLLSKLGLAACAETRVRCDAVGPSHPSPEPQPHRTTLWSHHLTVHVSTKRISPRQGLEIP